VKLSIIHFNSASWLPWVKSGITSRYTSQLAYSFFALNLHWYNDAGCQRFCETLSSHFVTLSNMASIGRFESKCHVWGWTAPHGSNTGLLVGLMHWKEGQHCLQSVLLLELFFEVEKACVFLGRGVIRTPWMVHTLLAFAKRVYT
jgi:hypothetical protein